MMVLSTYAVPDDFGDVREDRLLDFWKEHMYSID